ncbi:MAG: alkylmercury lyase [Bacteroidetes bacterium]|nr:alkylmercury lyase [Bacteroidota bacterium]
MIEFQFFEGCPYAHKTLQHLREVMSELHQKNFALKIIEVPNPESAQRMNFQGSPTILVNGVDIYTGEQPIGYSYTCRIYEFSGEKTGIIPKEFIKEKLK